MRVRFIRVDRWNPNLSHDLSLLRAGPWLGWRRLPAILSALVIDSERPSAFEHAELEEVALEAAA